MMLDPLQYALGAGSGALVGFTLGLFGGGGSILAVPLIVYLVQVPDPHLAIGTSALAVAVSAAANLANHARHGHVKWRCGLVFSAAGIFGALIGSSISKVVDGQKLLIVFALLMIAVAVMMLVKRSHTGDAGAQCGVDKMPKVLSYGAMTGTLSGFFGIGGGFLIVPGLVASTGMPTLYAVGSSLVAVTAFGLTTAFNYALSDMVDWPLAAVFILGGVVGGLAGAVAARALSLRKGALNIAFAGLVFAVAGYMLFETLVM
ncbi:sulfite exporter TauE/SafE family protein [Methyloligella solikamskensis]|uniref:Probable membrane transporter protein n=1 Tax=Methyloligella solikamskensis TaxID=1177756 RepID=A0ABW3J8B3_9HYPH